VTVGYSRQGSHHVGDGNDNQSQISHTKKLICFLLLAATTVYIGINFQSPRTNQETQYIFFLATAALANN
jgi:Ni,Fe-hydrogenase I cytochrome b subunit